MINKPPLLTELLDWESLNDESVELSTEQVAQAVQLSQPIPNRRQQWPVYLQALALAAFKEWLIEWAPDLSITDSHCSIFQPPYANLIEAACNLHVNSFNLCLVATGRLMDTVIHLPKAAVDLPPFVPNFYVLIEVLEEQMQVQIYGYLHRAQLVEQQQSRSRETDDDWNYAIPLSWFTPKPIDLISELRCLKPETSPLSIAPKQDLIPAAQLQRRLTSLLPQLRSPRCSLQQLLSWEDIATILSDPKLADWFYQIQQSDVESQKPTELNNQLSLASPLHQLQQRAINVASWLSDRLDTLAQELAWVLMPAQVSVPAFRSAKEELEIIGVHIPPEARGAYHDLFLGAAALRVYTITWILDLPDETSGWTLLILLGAQPGGRLPSGIRLQIRDATTQLSEQSLEEETQHTYLYAQVGGTWTDQFWVTIEQSDGITLTLPPFVFNPEDLS